MVLSLKEFMLRNPQVFKLKKALYNFKQDPKIQFERPNTFLISKGFYMSKIFFTIFIKHEVSYLIIMLMTYSSKLP